jgi:ComF family protein
LYNDVLRTACIRAKAATQSPLAAALANFLWLQECHEFDSASVDLVVPVPRHWTKHLMLPHHAAETISRVLARRLGKPHVRGLLRKIRWTPDQSDLTATNRKLNLKDAFAVRPRPRSLAGKTVLLVDDILTTGTTANECTRALLHAGAAKVIVAVVAVVPPSSR